MSSVRLINKYDSVLRHLDVLHIFMIYGLSYDFALHHLHVAQICDFCGMSIFHPINE